jgi:uncharacterized protein (TIGR01244 family)
MNLPVRALAPDFCVAPQLTPEAMAQAAQAGFKSVINNRPDFEQGPEQPTHAAIAEAARAAGLHIRHLPVAPNHQSPQEIAAFRALLLELPRPILAFCRSGNRSSLLYHAASAR